MLSYFMSLLSATDFSFEIVVLKISFRNADRVSNSMETDDA